MNILLQVILAIQYTYSTNDEKVPLLKTIYLKTATGRLKNSMAVFSFTSNNISFSFFHAF